jgi:transforming growth factor-beta-induced protein
VKATRRLLAPVFALALMAAACADDDDTAAEDTTTTAPATDPGAGTDDDAMDEGMDDGAAAQAEGDIVDVAAGAGQFDTLVAAVQAAGLEDTLRGAGPYTVFAPTDQAFQEALDALGLTAEELLADTETLTAILTYHVVPGEVPAAEVVELDGAEVGTVNGANVTITVDGEMVMVNEAMVVQTDVMASNGVIHVIDSVLLPPDA